MSSSFKITVVSDAQSWINQYIPRFVECLQQQNHHVEWLHDVTLIPKGDFVFYLSCGQIVPSGILLRNKHNLVVHESALPHGKGWSPLTWQILEGKDEIPILLFEAAEKVDSGRIYLSDTLKFKGTELVDELRKTQAMTTVKLCHEFVKQYPEILIQAVEQTGEPSYYRRRVLEDSQLDPDKTIREQFNLLRVVDNERYPAFFEIKGERYIISIEKAEYEK